MIMRIFGMILLQVVLIALNAIFACAEIAVLSFNEKKLEKMAEEGDRRARRLRKLTKIPARFLATIQVAITLSGFLGSAFAADNFGKMIADAINVHVPTGFHGAINTLSVILTTVILSYFTLVFGELVPKRLAMRKAEQVSLALSRPLSWVATVFAPLVGLLTKSTNGVLRLLGIDPDQSDEEVSEEDIRLMVDAGSQNGAIDSEEHEFIQNIFAFDDLTAGEISTHRTDVIMLWAEDNIEIWEKTIHENRFTFYPVCGESKDDIIGILNAKDYFRIPREERDTATLIRDVVKPAYFVPDGVTADVLFRNMKQTRNKIAVVLDEYGGMVGIVTMTDLIERLVGNISDDDAEQPGSCEKGISQNEDGSWYIPGTAALADVEEALGITFEDEDSETFGGLVFSALGTIPADGTTCDIDLPNMHVHILEVLDHQMVSANVTVIEQPSEKDKEGKEEEDEDEEEKHKEKDESADAESSAEREKERV